MKNQFSELPSDLISWNALQDALSGIRDELSNQEKEKKVIEIASQTEVFVCLFLFAIFKLIKIYLFCVIYFLK